jgi:hypothetical protein
VDQALGPSSFVQVIDILSDDQQIAWPLSVKRSQCPMREIWIDLMQLGAPLVIESMHKGGVMRQRFWRADVLDMVTFPQTIRAAKGGKAAFSRDTSASQDHDIGYVVHCLNLSRRVRPRQARTSHAGYR